MPFLADQLDVLVQVLRCARVSARKCVTLGTAQVCANMLACGQGRTFYHLRAGRLILGELLYLPSHIKVADSADNDMHAGRRESEQMPSLARHRLAHVCAQILVRQAQVRVCMLAPRDLPEERFPRGRCSCLVVIVS